MRAKMLCAGLAAAVSMTGMACKQVKVEDTTADFIRTAQVPCTDSGSATQHGSQPRRMDTYVIQVLELSDPVSGAHDPLACEECMRNGMSCGPLFQTCLCGGPTDATPEQLKASLSGTHLGTLDYGDLYCLRVLAVDRSALDTSAPHECTCSPAWTDPVAMPAETRLCALSTPYAAGPLDFQLDVRCPGDGHSFWTCLGNAM